MLSFRQATYVDSHPEIAIAELSRSLRVGAEMLLRHRMDNYPFPEWRVTPEARDGLYEDFYFLRNRLPRSIYHLKSVEPGEIENFCRAA